MAETLGPTIDTGTLPALAGCYEIGDDTSELPYGFPSKLASSLAWQPDDILARRDETILQLTQSDLTEINDALAEFKSSGLEIYQLSPNTFPLPSVAARFASFKTCLHEGPGFFTVRGLTPSKWDARENIIIHAGIASYFGNKRALQQNYYSNTADAILHVCDVRQDIASIREDTFLAPGNQSIGIGFHSDNGDNVSLYCRQVAATGGDLYLSSTWAIYNELAAHHRDVLRVLAAPWLWQMSRLGDEELRTKNVPLFYFRRGKLIVDYQKRPLRGSREEPRDPRLKPITLKQEEALSVVDKLAYENAISVDQQAGDINFFNNLALLHARSAFVDDDDQQVRRHLTRLIFRDEVEGWDLPESMGEEWKKYYDHDLAVEIFGEEPTPWAWSLMGHD
ncbi:hypothetical protein B0T25DRAFT_574607 [Lasiosphaeria hispida]|uniref:TauD/TfdA-like domain-containing protein n=1 Tax=Lasiosphaeria hispida TaxID=260671 RepID=A0AAJ0H4Z5_9PEZI|nr:hypothetical protein B0T25DRAFT_574607 [Lasiosphaeria hispida]